MELSVNEIKEYYKTLQDSEIIDLAKNPAGLRKEIVPIFLEELKTRGLKSEFENWVRFETDSFEDEERDLMIAKIEQGTCCSCGTAEQLFGFRYDIIYGIVVFTKFQFIEQILCRSCGRSERFKNMGKAALFGWWSAKGLFYTPYILFNSVYRLFTIKSESKRVINNFIDSNTGRLRLVNKGKLHIQDVISEFNNNATSPIPLGNV